MVAEQENKERCARSARQQEVEQQNRQLQECRKSTEDESDVNSTPHTSHFLIGSHLMTRTCVAQAQVWLAQRTFRVISCIIFMRSCCVCLILHDFSPLLFLLSRTFRPIRALKRYSGRRPQRQQLPEKAQRERQPRWRRKSKCRKHFNREQEGGRDHERGRSEKNQKSTA